MTKKNVKHLGKKSTLLATSVAVVASSMMPLPAAMADNGVEDPGTGIVWGFSDSQNGSYMVPLEGGGMEEGYCIDPGAAYPKQNGITEYGPPVPWGGQLGAHDYNSLAIALALGNAVKTRQTGIVHQFLNNIAPFAHLAGVNADWGDDNHMAAGVSLVVHTVGLYNDKPNPLPPGYLNEGAWDGRLRSARPQAQNVFDSIKKAGEFSAGFFNAAQFVSFHIRHPKDAPKQRMVVMSDIQMPNVADFFGKLLGAFQLNFDTGTSTTTTTTTTTPPPDTPKTPGTPDTTTTRTEPGETPEKSTETLTRTKKTTKTKQVSTPRLVRTSTFATTRTEVKTENNTTPFTTYSTTEDSKTPDVQIRTSAGTKTSNVLEAGGTIVDTVTYQGLNPGDTYTMVGELVDKGTGEKTGDRAIAKFTTKTANGTVDIKIPVKNAYSDSAVVFETLFDSEGKKVAEHHDVKDRAQTVGRPISTPEIRTSVSSSTGNNIQSGTVVNDTVLFKGVVPGRKYRLEASLICKADGRDTGAKQSHEFTPDTANGTTVVEGIAVTNPDCLQQVAFEKLYEVNPEKGDVLVATHQDINDAAQTFGGEHVGKKKKKIAPKKTAPKPTRTTTKTIPTPQPMAPVQPAPVAHAPRQVINAVPSGAGSTYGDSIFTR